MIRPCPYSLRDLVCRTHLRQGKLRKLVLFTNPRKRAVICLWKRLYEDSRTIGVSIALTQAEVAEMLETLEILGAPRVLLQSPPIPKLH